MFRFNNPDALLVLLLTIGAYAMVRALESGGTKWLVAGLHDGRLRLPHQDAAGPPGRAGLRARVPDRRPAEARPPARPARARRRSRCCVSAGWWVAIVELVPASARPYIGGSQNNSVLNLDLRLQRLRPPDRRRDGQRRRRRARPAAGGARPAGSACSTPSSAGRRRGCCPPRSSSSSPAWCSRGGPSAPTAPVPPCCSGVAGSSSPARSSASARASSTRTTRSALGPAIGALVGIGAWLVLVAAVRARVPRRARRGHRRDGVVVVPAARAHAQLAAVAAGCRPVAGPGRGDRRAGGPPDAGRGGRRCGDRGAGHVAGRHGRLRPGDGFDEPTAGPSPRRARAVPAASRGGPGGVPRRPAGGPNLGGPNGFQGGRAGTPPGQTGTGQTGTPARPAGTGRRAVAPSAATVASAACSTAARRATSWSPCSTPTPTSSPGWRPPSAPTRPPATSWPRGDPVMAIGGFNGTDPWPTLAEFQQYVSEGKIHYFIGGGQGGRRRPADRARRARSRRGCTANFTATTVGGVTLYDLSSPSS